MRTAAERGGYPWRVTEPGTHTEAEQEALLANEGFYRALGNSDMGAMEQVWARMARVTCLHPGWTLLTGREEVLESWRTILSNPNQPRIVGGGASVSVLGNTAVILCREVVSGSPLYATNVFVREEGSWRMTHHHSGPVMVPGTEA
ncbi:MAG: nuclear transport factor 2 family protein [Dehalococcoidia bacterium]|nr:nuclear transport factor 2 family protein [Dehalococcoidia bacterium]